MAEVNTRDSAGALRYWHFYSKYLDTARLVSIQMCLPGKEQLTPFKNNDELIEVVTNPLVQRKRTGESFDFV